MFYGGMSNVPGAPGNLMAGGNFMGGAGSAINPEDFKRDTRQQKIYNKGKSTDNPNEKEIFLQRTGPQLPFAGIGNEGGLMAQVPPGMGAMGGMPPAGNMGGMAGGLGGPMTMGPRFGPRPLNLDINAVDNRIESVGGSANIQIDPNQTLRFGGSFNPAFTDQMGMQNPQSYNVYGEYNTPGFGVNVNYRNTGRGAGPQNMPMPGGFPGEIQAGIRGRF